MNFNYIIVEVDKSISYLLLITLLYSQKKNYSYLYIDS